MGSNITRGMDVWPRMFVLLCLGEGLEKGPRSSVRYRKHFVKLEEISTERTSLMAWTVAPSQ